MEEQFDSIEDYVSYMKKEGYWAEDGEPLKCFCGHTDFKQNTTDTIGYLETEYEWICKNCNKSVGFWSYGYWQLY